LILEIILDSGLSVFVNMG